MADEITVRYKEARGRVQRLKDELLLARQRIADQTRESSGLTCCFSASGFCLV